MSIKREFRIAVLTERLAPFLGELGFAPAERGGYRLQSPRDHDACVGVRPVIGKRSSRDRLLYTFDVGLWFPRIDAVLGSPSGQAHDTDTWHAKCRSTDAPEAQARGDFERASWYYFDGSLDTTEAEWQLARQNLNWALDQMLPLASEVNIEAFWGAGSYNGQTATEHAAYLRAVRRALNS